MLVQDMVLRQQQNPQEQPMYTVEVFSDGSRSPEVVKKDKLADTGIRVYKRSLRRIYRLLHTFKASKVNLLQHIPRNTNLMLPSTKQSCLRLSNLFWQHTAYIKDLKLQNELMDGKEHRQAKLG